MLDDQKEFDAVSHVVQLPCTFDEGIYTRQDMQGQLILSSHGQMR